MSLAVHTQDRAQDRAAVVAAHTPAAAAAATHRTATADIRLTPAEDRHPMAAEVHRRMVAVAAIAIRNHLPATAKVRSCWKSFVDEHRKSDGQPTVALAAFQDEL